MKTLISYHLQRASNLWRPMVEWMDSEWSDLILGAAASCWCEQIKDEKEDVKNFSWDTTTVFLTVVEARYCTTV